MKKTLISFQDWQELEHVLMNHRIGYEVIFDDHNGTAEMIIDVQQIGVYRHETPMMEDVSI
jgi:predicted mannosyl-3-phosphoglycerate phosphatase (HAD superfamily)